eukprot:gene9019-1118_t
MGWDDLTEEEQILLDEATKTLPITGDSFEEMEITWTQEIGKTSVFVLFVLLLSGFFFVTNWFFNWWYFGYDGLASRYESEYLQTFNADRCKSNLKKFSTDFYEYANNASYNNALLMKSLLKEYLYKSDVEINTYHVLISKPTGNSYLKMEKKNSGTVVYSSTFLEEGFENLKKQAYSPYSGNGEIITDSIVYVNFGRLEDFEYLKQNMISVKGKVLLARHGKLNSGSIVENSESNGASAVLLFSDPIEEDGFGSFEIFPNGPLRRNSSIFRTSSLFHHDKYPGDPLTPGYPAKENAYRLKREEAENIPKKNFIVQPISKLDAEKIMSTIKGKIAPDHWRGGLDATYMIGGETSEIRTTLKVELDEHIAPIHNVIAKITGFEEKDKSIMIGHHRDSYGNGVTDPNTGTVVLLEIAKGLGKILSNKWKPRRNIIISSWDANELGLIGSTEYTEEYKYQLSNELVSYLNIDSVVGDKLNFEFSPTLMSFIESQSERVDSPVHDNETLFDEWKRQHPTSATQLEGGQDYTAFTHHIGVSVTSLGFKGAFGAKHSLDDTLTWFEKFGDSNFKKSKSMVHLVGMILLRLAGNHVLPFNFQRQSDEIFSNFNEIFKSKDFVNFTSSLKPDDQLHLDTLMNTLNRTIDSYQTLTHKFNVKIEEMKGKAGKQDTSFLIRQTNDRILTLEKSFLNSEGLVYSNWHKNIIYGPAKNSGDKFIYFPEFHTYLKERSFKMLSFSVQRIIVCLENSILTLKNQ